MLSIKVADFSVIIIGLKNYRIKTMWINDIQKYFSKIMIGRVYNINFEVSHNTPVDMIIVFSMVELYIIFIQPCLCNSKNRKTAINGR